MTLYRTIRHSEPTDPPPKPMSDTMKIAIVAVALISLVIVARVMDYHYETQSAAFSIESCVAVDLIRGEIKYTPTRRCSLVVKAFKAGRQSTLGLSVIPESK